MWETLDKTRLLQGITRAQRLDDLFASPVGEDLRDIIREVSQTWFDKVLKGEPSAFAGLQALDDVVRAFDLTITLADGLRAELIRRERQKDEDNGTSNATAAIIASARA